jgi:hypothetical protein
MPSRNANSSKPVGKSSSVGIVTFPTSKGMTGISLFKADSISMRTKSPGSNKRRFQSFAAARRQYHWGTENLNEEPNQINQVLTLIRPVYG